MFATGASLCCKSQFLYYWSEAVLGVAISPAAISLQMGFWRAVAVGAISLVPGCIESCSFFTTDAILFSKLQFLY